MTFSLNGVSALVVRARDSADAFSELVVLLQDFAVGSAYSYLKDLSLAEDAAQESFITAWRQLHSLRDPELFVAWFKRIIASQCHRVLRRKSNRVMEQTDVACDADALETLVSRKERNALIREALEHLPQTERLVVILYYFSGRSHSAIATFLNVPRTTVVKRLYSARRRLAAALAPFSETLERARPSRSRAFQVMVRAGIYDEYVGLYRFDRRPELTVRVTRVGNRLVSHSAGQKNRVMLGSQLSDLRAAEFDGRARFVRNKSGRITHFVYYEFGRRMGIAKKVTSGTGA